MSKGMTLQQMEAARRLGAGAPQQSPPIELIQQQMEQQEMAFEANLRGAALGQAVELHKVAMPTTPGKIVEAADVFLKFLKGNG